MTQEEQSEMETLLRYLKTLADQTRLRILGLLANQPRSVEELAHLLDLKAATISWHLGKLDKARQYYMLTEWAATDSTRTTPAEVYWDYYDLALAQLALGKTEEARKSYEKAMGETPGVLQFDSVLSVLYFLQKASDRMPGLDKIIDMLEKEKATRVSPG